MELLTAVIAFVAAHWSTVASVLGGLAGVVALLQKKAYEKAVLLALDLVREAAVKELSGPEKRKWVADELWKVLPLWVKKALGDETTLLAAVERAYSLLRGELKTVNTTNVDPTVGVLDTDNLHISAPDNLKVDK